MPLKDPEARRAYERARRQTPEYRARERGRYAASRERERARKRTPECRARYRARYATDPELRAYRLARRRTPLVRLAWNLYNRVRKELGAAAARIYGPHGATPEAIMRHLEAQFRPGMTRENYGTAWQVDHIRPLKSFNMADPDQAAACLHWSNLQPLTPEENNAKEIASRRAAMDAAQLELPMEKAAPVAQGGPREGEA